MPKYLKTSKKLKLIICLLSAIAVIYMHFIFNVNPILIRVSNSKVKSFTTVAINTAAQDVMNSNMAYENLIDIQKDENGKIIFIKTNTILINDIARQTISTAQSKINQLGQKRVEVPIGSLSGITIFSGLGPNIKIKVMLVGVVNMTYRTIFEKAGINQTRHKIIMNMDCKVNIVIPGKKNTISVKSEVLLVESIIIGEVPQIYFENNSQQKIDIVP